MLRQRARVFGPRYGRTRAKLGTERGGTPDYWSLYHKRPFTVRPQRTASKQAVRTVALRPTQYSTLLYGDT
jgi:hypothetical protein